MLAWGQRRKTTNIDLAPPAEEIVEKPEMKREPRRIALALGGELRAVGRISAFCAHWTKPISISR